ncbi:MAG: paaD [Solirubrobacterales bacterium]|nr:paaD [Solirubrobacterales bacterium]
MTVGVSQDLLASTEAELREYLARVEDPELPVSITELGMLRGVTVTERESGGVAAGVSLVPTFLGCSAQLFIERDVRAAVDALEDLTELHVEWCPATEWSTSDITSVGREQLRHVGVAVPDPDGGARCPHCGSERVVVDSEFGAALCRRLGHCEACGDPVEIMRSTSSGGRR